MNDSQRDSEKAYQQLYNSTPDLMWCLTRDFKLITSNSAFAGDMQRMSGRTPAPGDYLLMENVFTPELIAWWKVCYQRALKGEAFNKELYTAATDTAGERWMEVNFNPLYEAGDICGIACCARDITQRKNQEEELNCLNRVLEQRVKDLSASNEKLEQFAYIASHDLQEPLRVISSFLQLLRDRYSSKIDEEGINYIRFATDGARRMMQLIRNLLDDSKAGRTDEQTGNVDVNEVITEVLNIYQGKIEELKAEIRLSPLPVLTGVPKSQILHLLLNLVNNALKYHAGGRPCIEIAALREEHHWLFSVKDNGIGIEADAQEKIFELFQRLHSNDRYTGTGVGLAISKKAVESWGGRIWAESQPGEGSTFYFTFPHYG